MTLDDVRAFLEYQLRSDTEGCFGVPDKAWLRGVVDNWFNDSENYDGRWALFEARGAAGGRVLDMAAGCGTFVLYGLHHGRNVVGVEPEEWKREYYGYKIAAAGYPQAWLDRIVEGVGEELPFEDGSFDLVTTYQTLEHVSDVRLCLSEMLRVLRPGGVLHVRAPDYGCFYEPHYRLPFLPRMNRRLAKMYLNWLGRPVDGLRTLNWVTRGAVVEELETLDPGARIEDTARWHATRRRERIRGRLPAALRNGAVLEGIEALLRLRSGLLALAKTGRAEKVMDLWVIRGN